MTGSGFSGNWSSSGSEGGRGRGNSSFMSSDRGGKFNRFGGLPMQPNNQLSISGNASSLSNNSFERQPNTMGGSN